jgi:hypothetical protein
MAPGENNPSLDDKKKTTIGQIKQYSPSHHFYKRMQDSSLRYFLRLFNTIAVR